MKQTTLVVGLATAIPGTMGQNVNVVPVKKSGVCS